MKKVLIVIISLFVISGCTKKLHIKDAKISDHSYEMFGEVPNRNFFVNENIDTILILKWKSKINGSFSATSFTAYGDFIFVPDLSGRVYSFDISDGETIGALKEKGVIDHNVLIDRLHIYYFIQKQNSKNSIVKKFNYSTGKEISELKIENVIVGEPIKLEDGILILTEDGTVYKVSFELKEIWKIDTQGKIYSTAAVIDDKAIFSNAKKEIFLIDLNSGKIILKKKFDVIIQSGFTSDGKNIFTATANGEIISLSKNDLKITWKFSSGYKINNVPVYDDKFLYVSNLRGNIYKFNKETGEKIWKTETSGIMNSTPLLFKNYLLQPDLYEKLLFINTETGKVEKEIKFDKRVKLTPLFYKNTLLIGIDDGQVYAYE